MSKQRDDTCGDNPVLDMFDESDQSTSALQARLKKLEEQNIKKSSERAKSKSGHDKVHINEDIKISPQRSSHNALEAVQLSLFASKDLRFDTYPIAVSTEYPTFLTRIPIFIPSKRTNQRSLLDEENAIAFETPWGAGKKFGPPLTVYDEDTLMAIGRLRAKGISGRPHNLPLAVSELYRSKDQDDVNVHVVCCMLTDIQKECSKSAGGRNSLLRLNSIKRLAATTIELDSKTADKIASRGTNIKLIDVAWEQYHENAILYIQFTPIMARWFEESYTYLDWELRKKLPDTGKAIHRFLSGQPKAYEIYVDKLITTLRYPRERKYFIRELKQTMDILKVEGWVLKSLISGTGRSKAHKLTILRS